MSKQDYYATLEVEKTASAEDLKRANAAFAATEAQGEKTTLTVTAIVDDNNTLQRILTGDEKALDVLPLGKHKMIPHCRVSTEVVKEWSLGFDERQCWLVTDGNGKHTVLHSEVMLLEHLAKNPGSRWRRAFVYVAGVARSVTGT